MIPDYTSQLKKIPDMSNKVLFLKNQGLVPTTIANILYVSVRTVNRYYDTKRQDYIKAYRAKSRLQKYYYLIQKINKFKNKDKNFPKKDFNYLDVIEKFGQNPICYLTGKPIDYYNGQSYHLDHVIPSRLGGTNELDNMQICSKYANQAKSDLSIEELYQLCQSILDYKK